MEKEITEQLEKACQEFDIEFYANVAKISESEKEKLKEAIENHFIKCTHKDKVIFDYETTCFPLYVKLLGIEESHLLFGHDETGAPIAKYYIAKKELVASDCGQIIEELIFGKIISEKMVTHNRVKSRKL